MLLRINEQGENIGRMFSNENVLRLIFAFVFFQSVGPLQKFTAVAFTNPVESYRCFFSVPTDLSVHRKLSFSWMLFCTLVIKG